MVVVRASRPESFGVVTYTEFVWQRHCWSFQWQWWWWCWCWWHFSSVFSQATSRRTERQSNSRRHLLTKPFSCLLFTFFSFSSFYFFHSKLCLLLRKQLNVAQAMLQHQNHSVVLKNKKQSFISLTVFATTLADVTLLLFSSCQSIRRRRRRLRKRKRSSRSLWNWLNCIWIGERLDLSRIFYHYYCFHLAVFFVLVDAVVAAAATAASPIDQVESGASLFVGAFSAKTIAVAATWHSIWIDAAVSSGARIFQCSIVPVRWAGDWRMALPIESNRGWLGKRGAEERQFLDSLHSLSCHLDCQCAISPGRMIGSHSHSVSFLIAHLGLAHSFTLFHCLTHSRLSFARCSQVVLLQGCCCCYWKTIIDMQCVAL